MRPFHFKFPFLIEFPLRGNEDRDEVYLIDLRALIRSSTGG